MDYLLGKVQLAPSFSDIPMPSDHIPERSADTDEMPGFAHFVIRTNSGDGTKHYRCVRFRPAERLEGHPYRIAFLLTGDAPGNVFSTDVPREGRHLRIDAGPQNSGYYEVVQSGIVQPTVEGK